MPGTPDPVPVMPGEVMTRDFFARPALDVARDLLGCVLERETAEGLVAVVLTEAEAYEGEQDPASHAFRGRTARNAVMFGPPGHAYVYFTYGMHFCVNLVCGPAGLASAVLLRAGRVVAGAELAAVRRGAPARRGAAGPGGRDLARGPARLCQAMAIDRGLNGADVCDPASPIRLMSAVLPALVSAPARSGSSVPPATAPPASPPRHISHGPRVGVSAAGELPWRVWLTGDPTVSVYRPHTPRRRQAVAPRAGQRETGAPGRQTSIDPPHNDGTMQR